MPCYACVLQLLLQTWASDYGCHNKVLLFSHSTRCLDLLEVSDRPGTALLDGWEGQGVVPEGGQP